MSLQGRIESALNGRNPSEMVVLLQEMLDLLKADYECRRRKVVKELCNIGCSEAEIDNVVGVFFEHTQSSYLQGYVRGMGNEHFKTMTPSNKTPHT